MVAERMREVEESPTVGLSGLVTELRAKGEDVISLAAGEPDFPTPAHIVEAAQAALEEGFTKYTPSPGLRELREAIAETSRARNGIPCEADHVLVSSAKHALFAAILAHVGPGDEVLVPDPGWVSYVPMVQLAGGRVGAVACPEEEGFVMTPEALAERITPFTRVVVVNSPNNPTGAVYPQEALEGILELAEDHDFLLLTDEIYEHLVYEGEHVSPASLEGAFERTITVNGFSKTYAMTGWRLGWAVAPRPLLKPMDTVQQHTVTCATAFAQKGGVAALRGPTEPREEMVAEFARRRDLLVDGLGKLPGLECLPPAGTFYAWVRLADPVRVADREDSVAFAEWLLEKARVAVVPGIAFGETGRDRVRLSFAASRGDLEKALTRMAEALG